MNIKPLLFIFFLLPILAKAQSPWTPGKGKQYSQLSYTTVPSYNQLFLDNGSLELDRFITDNTIQAYTEFGIGNKFALIGVVPLKMIKVGEKTDEQSVSTLEEQTAVNLGDAQLGLKYNFLQKGKWAFGASLLTSFPTSDEVEIGLRSGFDEFHVRPSLSAGISDETYYGYGFISYNWFNDRIDPSIYWGIEFGFKIVPSFIIAAEISSIRNLKELDPNPQNVGSGLFLNGFEYTAVLVKFIKEFVPDKFGVLFSFGGGQGNLVAQSPALTLGAYLKVDWNKE